MKFEVNKIYNVDCFKAMKQMLPNSVDTAFTSPPYNRKRNDKYSFYDDDIDYFQMLCELTDDLLTIVKGKIIINVQANSYNKHDVYRWLGQYSNYITGVVIWNKLNPVNSTNRRDDGTCSVTNAFEYFIFLSKKDDQFRCYGSESVMNVITTSVNEEHFQDHHAVMKKEVADWFIEKFTRRGDIVLDPFMGLGTTAISCSALQRNFIGFEIVKEYYDKAIQRIKYESQMKMEL